MISQDRGDLHAAKADFIAALESASDRDFVRFELEDTIANVCGELDDSKSTEKWFVAALRTAAADPRVAGGGFLLRFLRFRGARGFSEEERRLVERVVRQSWHLLRVEEQPDLTDLEATCRKLIEAQRGPFSAKRPPTPKVYAGPAEEG